MPHIDLKRTSDLLREFKFRDIFIDELAWGSPPTKQEAYQITVEDVDYSARMIAQVAGICIFEITAPDGKISLNEDVRKKIHKQVTALHHENVLIFIDGRRTESLWYWVRREGDKSIPKRHFYSGAQDPDLFLSKIANLEIELSDVSKSGDISTSVVADRLQKALSVDEVTKKFFREFQQEHIRFLEHIRGIPDDRDKRWYASVLMNRLMFIYFLQKKFFLDNKDSHYLRTKLEASKTRGKDHYYSVFLQVLFFKAFASAERSRETLTMVGDIPYLNGGLFLKHPIEEKYQIEVNDEAFDNILQLFESYSWNLDDRREGNAKEINPDVLGYIFEKYINQKAFGAYYTRPEITTYLCEHTIYKYILDKTNDSGVSREKFDTIPDLLIALNSRLCNFLLELLPTITILDPACGSGAFLVAAMKTLISVYAAIFGKIKFLSDTSLTLRLKKIEAEHPSLNYYIKKRIITDNLYGVDIMEEATEIAKLRLFLALIASGETRDQLEPLPNIDFNILAGNSLIGLLNVNVDGHSNLFAGGMERALEEKDRLVKNYKDFGFIHKNPNFNPGTDGDLSGMRSAINKKRSEANSLLNQALLSDFNNLRIPYEQVTWDEAKQKEGKPIPRPLKPVDIERLHPFHWGYEFDQILARGGFDIIITNPPWDVFQTDEKEFFMTYFPEVQKKKITIDKWKTQFKSYMRQPELRERWLTYSSNFAHVSRYFKSGQQFTHQQPVIEGKKRGGKINLYSLFIEQCHRILRNNGIAGVVVPSGVYTDMGDRDLRVMLFEECQILGLFGFENRAHIFEGVDSRFKFVVLTFQKGGPTRPFPVAFMRKNVSDLDSFPTLNDLFFARDQIAHLSPSTLSLMELKTSADLSIVEAMLRFPAVGLKVEGVWNLRLSTEFNMNTDSYLFRSQPFEGRLPLCEGKMFHQFVYDYCEAKYWLNERDARKALLGNDPDIGQMLAYQDYRLAFRDIAASTNERTMIATILPPNVFCPHTVSLENVGESNFDAAERVVACSLLNSFVVDYSIRQSITSHLSFYLVNNLHIPRLTARDSEFFPILRRTLPLLCTQREFAKLYNSILRLYGRELRGMATTWTKECGATDPQARLQLRAELDAIIAHAYGLTEAEFAHILSTFPIVKRQSPEVIEKTLTEFQHSEQ